MKFLVALCPFLACLQAFCDEPAISHRLLVTGGSTYIREADGTASWTYPASSRDGWVLKDGTVLLALSKSKAYPGGAALLVDKGGKTLFEWKGTQAEVNTVQAVGDHFLVTEAGDKPRLLELDRGGRIVVDVPLQAQTKNHHLQSRMARKLPNGNYLVPQLLDKTVREYTPEGKIVWEAATPDMPFTAIRLEDGNTLVGCTHGHMVVELDKAGKIVWQITNEDLPGKPIKDACGVQRLPNGNTVVTAYAAKADDIRMFEVTREKKIVWTMRDPKRPGVHHFQVLETNGKAIEGEPRR